MPMPIPMPWPTDFVRPCPGGWEDGAGWEPRRSIASMSRLTLTGIKNRRGSEEKREETIVESGKPKVKASWILILKRLVQGRVEP